MNIFIRPWFSIEIRHPNPYDGIILFDGGDSLTKVIKVVVADNEEVFLEGIDKILTEHPYIQVVSRCLNPKEVVAHSRRDKPDVLLLREEMSGDYTDAIIKEVTSDCPEVKIAIMKQPGEVFDEFNHLKAGAKAYLATNISGEDLIKSIDLISSGRIIISPMFAQQFTGMLSENKGSNTSADDKGITEREKEIAEMVAKGKTNKEIASELYIAENTVKMHVKNILGKLELKNRQQLSVYAVLHKWINQEQLEPIK